jgi:hypothetical protein
VKPFSSLRLAGRLLPPLAADCAWSEAVAKNQRRRLDEESASGFNYSADLSTYPRKISVRTTRATAGNGDFFVSLVVALCYGLLGFAFPCSLAFAFWLALWRKPLTSA